METGLRHMLGKWATTELQTHPQDGQLIGRWLDLRPSPPPETFLIIHVLLTYDAS